jgi:cell division protein FtsI (penicillin-binding protein 3)
MKRAKLFNFLIFFLSFIFFSYLFYIQCVKHQYYDKKAKSQHEKKFVLVGSRGNVYDRNGLPLAVSQQCFSIFCTPRYSNNKEALIDKLAILSGKSKKRIEESFNKGQFFWVENKIDLDKRNKYLGLDDGGIGYTHDLNRQYNMPEAFASIIGKCGSDNRGIEGLELQLNDVLTGKSGFAIYQKDPTGDVFPYHDHPERNPLPGQDVYLTLDYQLQAILYANLKQAMIAEDAKHAAGLIIDPHNGEILAMVNIGLNGDQRNHIICDEFEPGSTFKLITMTYALIEGFNESDVIDTEGGKLKIKGHTIHDYRDYGTVTFKQAIAHSSNVAMVKISKEFDRQNFYLLMRDFGLGQLSGIEFPGENKGRLPDFEDINDVEFATMVFGQGLTVNLLQLAFIYQAIANGGVLNKPIIVQEIKEGERVVYRAGPLRIRRVVDKEIAKRVTQMLCGVIEDGSGVEAAVDGVKVAGKTGTAQKVVNGKYSNTSIITTFVGYFPADSPDYLIAIMFDEPKHGLWASTIAAPVFKSVAHSIYQIDAQQYAVK